ncbi:MULTISPECIES: hypothetical protein [Xenorhabdus]|uniref:Uncharacterized protein n=2 Tax=Xenorhabdus TaxID=626 RepID=A0A1Q5TU39_9GAMM|nr:MULTISPECIES: hypothetical protein [Xenorhabdus]OKP03745.1 hypothetical protein Xentx_02892 [Xenorhabdus thuongxuanensis]OTA15237.1 hypothetical protein Xvie_03044 [Xenorhabdus vietnamensis]
MSTQDSNISVVAPTIEDVKRAIEEVTSLMDERFAKLDADGKYIQDIRLGSVESASVWKSYGFSDFPPYVITGVINHNSDKYIDSVYRRPLQKLVNGVWYNIGFI